jgi:hypothetical protein|eukprot:CAMPEP_0202502994 /NCGR_PEP_ID=MMETSP1361-20130828/40586_1 /ASSEMBLY_ACC=CAM_ASM_000849 /TAXON_ID=210615 /ORGANISM="Staurosira complex sp., Strain CCMP2646" /LENGTH=42 /DNA_ID= /DNA_START= /DNA_END= /DNA_ORIENTATION=
MAFVAVEPKEPFVVDLQQSHLHYAELVTLLVADEPIKVFVDL